VEDATLMRILSAATWAPSAHNRQPWRFMIVTEPNLKYRVALAMGERLRADRLADGDDPACIEQDVCRSRERITKAPAVVFVFLSMNCMDSYPDQRRCDAEYLMAVQSTAMATQNALLAAHEEGLGACVMCAPLFCPETVIAELGVPVDWRPQSVITIGWPAVPPRNRGRAPLAEVMANVG
jgi:coenzyme F420-0:L-glutamate ligase / coenzyme F420-1:gamma-L-glutamate ligase